MLESRVAIDFALELTRTPTLATAMQAQRLPDDTLIVIKIAAGCEETARAAVEATALPASTLREACVHYLQRILFSPDADCFRVLGVSPGTTRSVMREHMRWLMRWLHPDRNPDEWESVFAERVLSAWREAEKQDATAAAASGDARPQRRSRRSRRFRQRWVRVPLKEPRRERMPRRAIAVAVIIGAIVLVLFAVPARGLFSQWWPGLKAGDETTLRD